MTLQELKDKYAESLGYEDWDSLKNQLLRELDQDEVEALYNHLIFLAQRKALENAHQVFLDNDVGDTLEQGLILHEKNILK